MNTPAPFAGRPSKPQVMRDPDGLFGIFMGGAYQFTDDAGARHLRDQIDALLPARSDAATLRQQAAQPDDSRCPSTYRREEAVKVLIGMGWSWDGKQWNAPVQQAARVDEAMVFRAMRAWGEAPPHGDINRMRAALEAALSAQPAERQGECVGEVFGPKAVSTMVALDRPLPPGTKLYTHPAATVGVPDEYNSPTTRPLYEMALQQALGEWMEDEWRHGDTGWILDRAKELVSRVLAAAPSAPQVKSHG